MSDSIEKQYISANELLADAYRLGLRIIESDFRPNFIIGVWRGGTPVGIAVQELLDYVGIKSDHIAIRTSLYTTIDQRGDELRVHGMGYLVKNMNHTDRLLIVDDVFDSGISMQGILTRLGRLCRRNLPAEIRIATTYFKPTNNRTELKPDYFVHQTDRWLVFPHELDGLTEHEIEQNKPAMTGVLDRLRELRLLQPG